MNAQGPTPTEAEAQSLLDFTRDLDIKLLDAVVMTVMMPPNQRQQEYCNAVLMTFKEHPEAWTRVDAVLEFSQSQQTKFFGLSVLEHTIKTRWKMLPPDQREAIREYIVGLVIKMSTSDETLNAERAFVAKLNQILVEILKQEWPHNWPNFISEIVAASKTNETLCQNNLVILKLLSEEVFDFSSGQMTKVKARRLKDTMNEQFSEVFTLCTFVMEHSQKPALILATLQTLHRFLTWIPLGYMFETTLIDTLIFHFFPVAMFRVVTLQCLTEIASIKLEADQYQEQLLRLFTNTMTQLSQMLPPGTNINVAYRTGSADEQALIQALSLFLTGFLKEHGKLLEARPDMHDVLLQAHDLLVMISDVDETEIFKICLEYWNGLAESLYQEDPVMVSTTAYTPFAFAQSNGGGGGGRRQLYSGVLSKVRLLMITHMVKPEEVLVVETESGEVVREFMPQHTDTLNQYRTMRETLVYLTHLDCTDTRNIMTEKLHKQVDKSEYSWKNLNTLCWAIGSISGAMSEEDEKQFLVTIIKYLLGMCEIVRGKDNKAVIASNIMYIVGQYPRFLRAHWKFLKTVVYKLFEFMHELHEGVQDMACDTFIKIAQKCRRYFVILQVGESMPFVDEIIQTMSTIICDLQPHQVHTFYEAVGYMISAAPDRQQRERLIQNCMALPNSAWDDIINRTAQDINTLQNPDMIKHLTNILKTNVAACTSIGHPFVIQLSKLYLDLLNLYKCISEMISNSITRNGEQVTKTQLIRSQRAVKKETLKLIETWISKSEDPQLVVDNFVPPLFEAVLGDYVRNIPAARDPEVLSCMTALVRKLQEHITEQVPVIFEAVFAVTLDMINKDLAEYPEHRAQFFGLLDAINDHCFPAFFAIPVEQFKLVIDSIVWAMKHTMRNVNETGLTILHNMLVNVSGHAAAQDFYKVFFVSLLEHIFAVVSDPAHQSGFKQICDILALMIALVEAGDIKVPLWEVAQVTDPAMTNQLFVRQYLATLLQSAFPNLQPDQVQITVEKLFLEYKDLPAFRQSLQDFLVQIKVFGELDVYVQAERQELELEKEARQKQLASIPGMLNPHAVNDTMAD